jgi:hypothetical protein
MNTLKGFRDAIPGCSVIRKTPQKSRAYGIASFLADDPMPRIGAPQKARLMSLSLDSYDCRNRYAPFETLEMPRATVVGISVFRSPHSIN